jgi:hypothetical protein
MDQDQLQQLLQVIRVGGGSLKHQNFRQTRERNGEDGVDISSTPSKSTHRRIGSHGIYGGRVHVRHPQLRTRPQHQHHARLIRNTFTHCSRRTASCCTISSRPSKSTHGRIGSHGIYGGRVTSDIPSFVQGRNINIMLGLYETRLLTAAAGQLAAAQFQTAAQMDTQGCAPYSKEHSPAARVFNNLIEDFTKSDFEIILGRF